MVIDGGSHQLIYDVQDWFCSHGLLTFRRDMSSSGLPQCPVRKYVTVKELCEVEKISQ